PQGRPPADGGRGRRGIGLGGAYPRDRAALTVLVVGHGSILGAVGPWVRPVEPERGRSDRTETGIRRPPPLAPHSQDVSRGRRGTSAPPPSARSPPATPRRPASRHRPPRARGPPWSG